MMIVVPALLAAVLAGPANLSEVKVQKVSVQKASLTLGAPGRADPDRIVCRREAVVGSRREKKLCLTSMEWGQRQDAAQRNMDTTLWGLGGEKPPMAPK